MNPWQDDVRGHDADHVGLVADIGGAGAGRPAIGLDRRAPRDIGGEEAVQRGGREILDRGQTKACGRVVFDFDAPATNILPWGERPPDAGSAEGI
jgi:hypothetical protein